MKYAFKDYLSDNAFVLSFLLGFILLLTISAAHRERDIPGQNIGLWVTDFVLIFLYLIVFTIDYFRQKKVIEKENLKK